MGQQQFTSHSHEFAAFTHGMTNEEKSTSASTQSASVENEVPNEEVLVKVEGMTQLHDSSADCYNRSDISLCPQGNAAHNHGEDNVMESPNVGIQVLEDEHESLVDDASSKRSDFVMSG